MSRYFPGGPVGKYLPSIAGAEDLFTLQEDHTCHKATKPLATTRKARAPQLEKPARCLV